MRTAVQSASTVGGTAAVQLQSGAISARHVHAQNQYVLHPRAFVGSWRPGQSDANVLASPPTQQSLRSVLFECEMRADDKARYLKASAKPSVWSAAPKLGAADKLAYGDKRAGQDTAMQQEQEKLLHKAALQNPGASPTSRSNFGCNSLGSLSWAFRAFCAGQPPKPPGPSRKHPGTRPGASRSLPEPLPRSPGPVPGKNG